MLVSLEDDQLLAKGKILSRQIRDDIEPSGQPSAAVFDDCEHQ